LIEAIVNPTKRYLDQSSTKKVAVLLSGGIDSSLLLKLLTNNLSLEHRKRIVPFCIGLKGSNDYENAMKFIKQLGCEVIYTDLYSNEESLKKIPEITYMVESRYSRVVKVALLQDKLAHEIKKHDIEVVISGEGSDELFYGYERFINGLIAKQVDEVNTIFFQRIFYYTLLQRYDRVFARHQIEGRVPYLDQEIVELSKKFTMEEKIQKMGERYLSKMPLRKIAKEIGVPEFIYNRKKQKMMDGATGQANAEDEKGYLEEYIRKTIKKSGRDYITEIYMKHFGQRGKDILQKPPNFITEEQLALQVLNYRNENDDQGVVTYVI
jgi:asparagine synthase (glutamine-hydrolysing)